MKPETSNKIELQLTDGVGPGSLSRFSFTWRCSASYARNLATSVARARFSSACFCNIKNPTQSLVEYKHQSRGLQSKTKHTAPTGPKSGFKSTALSHGGYCCVPKATTEVQYGSKQREKLTVNPGSTVSPSFQNEVEKAFICRAS